MEIEKIVDKTTPKKIIGLMLVELGKNAFSYRMTECNAWQVSDGLEKAIQQNREETDYLLSLL